MELLMREMLKRQGERTSCWSHGIQDPQVMKSVQAMHDDYARAWTLEASAQHAGLSRTSLAERFRKSMGNTPLNYLRTVGMQKGVAPRDFRRQDTEDKALAWRIG